MKYYKFKPDADNGFQAYCDQVSDSLLKKNLYMSYEHQLVTGVVKDDKAKLTDVLNEGTLSLKGIIVSEQFRNVVLNNKLHDIQFIPIEDEQLSNYSFMFFNGELASLIDYEKTCLKVQEWDPDETVYLDVDMPKNREGITNVYKEYCVGSAFNSLVPINGYYFKEDQKLIGLDFFRVGYFDLSFYISDGLKKKLEEEGISGWKCINSNEFYF